MNRTLAKVFIGSKLTMIGDHKIAEGCALTRPLRKGDLLWKKQ